MRLEILNSSYGFGTKVFFAIIRAFSRQPLPEAARLTFYRPDFYGARSKKLTHAAMRGPPGWSVAERELMAAFVSQANESAFCVGAHTATASGAYHDSAKVSAALTDLDTAPIEEPLRKTLRLLAKLSRTGTVTADDMRTLLVAGVSREQIEDALAVCFSFNVTNRLADAFGFAVLDAAGFEAGAKILLARGCQ